MKITITLLLLCLFFTLSTRAQNPYAVKGAVVDSIANAHLANTAVSVLNAKDSTLVKFVFAKEGGAFAIPNLKPGKFILLVSYPDYADYVERFTLDAAHPTHAFGSLNMQLKSRLLHDVVIKGTVNAIKIKGDTTEFNAKAYVNQPNDKVEDLLKQLPGIQIDKDGKITANGQAVNKVLVDGEEFFGDDPTLVTKNIRADMVDKVQLYDKKSDQAAFTGIDDGQKTKTINIKLKEDKKNGTFGKLDGGIGTQDRYEGQAIYNRFKAKQKYSAYATSANDGKTGLGFGDNNSLGSGGNNVMISDDGGIYITGNSNDALDSFNGTYNGRGKPLANSGGIHFDNKFGAGDKYTLNTNYKIGAIEVNGITTTTTQQNLSNGVINTDANQTFDNYAFRQKADGSYLIKFDTTSTLKISADGTLKNFRVNNDYNTVSSNGTGALINRNNRAITNNGDQQIANVSALYTKKFKKVGRTFSWNISEGYNDNNTKGYLNSEVDYYNKTTGNRDSVQNTNQYKTSKTLSSVLNSNMTYSEALTKTLSLLFNYGLGVNNSTSDNLSYNLSAPGIYNVLDNVYSNEYKFNQTTNQLGAILNYKTKKTTLNFGTRASNVDYKQINEFTGDTYKRSFINWSPQAFFQYRPSQQRSLYVSYNGNTTQPSITQLQPVKVNNDPLNIVTGNANLKPSFSNSISINYSSAKVLSGTSSYMYAYIYAQSDAIVNSNVTDLASGKTTTQYVNLTGHSPINYDVYYSTSAKIKSLGDINTGLNLSADGSTNYSYVNNALSESNTYSYSASARIYKNAQKKYYINLSGGPSYTINKFSLQPNNNANSAGFNANGFATYYLPKDFNISTDARYNYTAATTVFDAQYRTIWNASISKSFFKDQNLTFSLNAQNLLNQNVNFNRSVSANTISQTTTNSIGRYLMFTAVWNFTKFKTDNTPKP